VHWVYEDFHAEVFAKNMVLIMALPINQDLKKNTKAESVFTK
jgi:hypothetical protein